MEKSFLQREAELSKFNQGATDSRVEDETVPVVPHASNEIYDPNHPDADWTGRVARSFKKRTFNTHTASKLQSSGLVPAVEETQGSGKKLYADDIKYKSRDLGANNSPSAVTQLGPGEKLDCANWQTSYSLQTSTANVTPEAKGQISHRRRITPLYEQKKTAGRKRTSAASSRTSLLAGIGKALATSSTLEDVGQIPLERGFKDSVSKDMLVENLYVSRLEMILN